MIVNGNDYLWAYEDPLAISLPVGEGDGGLSSPLRIYKISGEGWLTIYEDEEKAALVYQGPLPFVPEEPVACVGLWFVTEEEKEITLISEYGTPKLPVGPYLNTREGMTAIRDGYVDDAEFTVNLPAPFTYDGAKTSRLIVSSNMYIVFTSGEQMKIMRRDGCSTYLGSQTINTPAGEVIFKYRFEGYTVYNDRGDYHRLIFELFLMPDGGMFLNLVQTPTNSNTGTSQLITSAQTINLDLVDPTGRGGGKYVSIYPLGADGKTWDVKYAAYERRVPGTVLFVFEIDGKWYLYGEEGFSEVESVEMTALWFMENGCKTLPPSEVIKEIPHYKVYAWSGYDKPMLVKDSMVAYPFPSDISFTANLMHMSIEGIESCEMEYTGEVGVLVSYNDGETYEEEITAEEWLDSDWWDVYDRLPASLQLPIKLRLHGNATVTSFVLHYINLEV